MANIYEGMNVRQKLAKARLQFLNQKVKKSGKNMHLEFKYFELEDIVPPAIRIFARVGLTTDIDFTDENGAVMRVYNTDNSEEAPIEFRVPYREVKPIVSNAGKEVTNPMQALGSSITYLRRYSNVTAVFVDTGLEYPEIREFVKTFSNVVWLKPKKNFKQVITEYGYPFISKEVSDKVDGARKYMQALNDAQSRERERVGRYVMLGE